MRLHVSDLAEYDLAQAYQWYESVRVGLGEDFNLCIEAAFATIAHMPYAYQAIEIDSVRLYAMQRFPYIIYYVIQSETVHIEAVIHSKRHPSVWQLRTPH